MLNKRDDALDISKAILILAVVLGHSRFPYSEYLYWFHMPVFFIISGMTLNPSKMLVAPMEFFKNKAIRLLIPTFCWWIVSAAFMGELHFKQFLYFMWGGRIIGGVHWFNTALFIAFILICIIYNKYLFKYRYLILSVLYVVAIGESIIGQETVSSLYVPWNADVAILATVFIGLGYELKAFIKESKVYVIIVSVIVFGGVLLLDIFGVINFEIYMKSVQYRNPIFTLLIPICAMIIIYASSRLIEKILYVNKLFVWIGKNSLLIMLIHIPIKAILIIPWLGEEYSALAYIVITIVCSAILQFIIHKSKILNFCFLGVYREGKSNEHRHSNDLV